MLLKLHKILVGQEKYNLINSSNITEEFFIIEKGTEDKFKTHKKLL